MPTAYRLVKTQYADSALDGKGAKQYGGRWNSKGKAVVYAADSLALAALELFVHLHRSRILEAYTLWTLQVPQAGLLTLATERLPPDWRTDPPPPSTAAIGDEWLIGGSSVALAVPSTLIPIQYNLLLNPGHPDFAPVLETARREPFKFDPRLA